MDVLKAMELVEAKLSSLEKLSEKYIVLFKELYNKCQNIVRNRYRNHKAKNDSQKKNDRKITLLYF